MRLIDADELLREHKDDITNWDSPYGVFNKSIENAQTVDPIKHGKWIKMDGFSYVKCSVCESEEDNSFYLFSYCPRCGTRMDG